MVTGDHPITAKSIARMVGIISPGMYRNILVLSNCIVHWLLLETLTPDEIKDPQQRGLVRMYMCIHTYQRNVCEVMISTQQEGASSCCPWWRIECT